MIQRAGQVLDPKARRQNVEFWRTPLDADRVREPRADVYVLEDRCKGCEFCVEYCPREVLAMAEHFNSKGYHPPMVVKTGECLNCNMCEAICPDYAIFTVKLPEALPATALQIAGVSRSSSS